MPDLATFQRTFADALVAEGQPAPAFRSQAFAVYRNTSARGEVEALRASYPTVDQLVGEEMFTQVALDYRCEHRPAGPVLSEYGSEFAAYLAVQPWTCELPYLADVARLDWLWLECFLAADAAPAPKARSDEAMITLHPATRYVWLATPAMTIWQAHRDDCPLTEFAPDWIEEGALFARPDLRVRAELIDAPLHHLLKVCSTPALTRDVAAIVSSAFPHANVPQLIQRGAESGALIVQ